MRCVSLTVRSSRSRAASTPRSNRRSPSSPRASCAALEIPDSRYRAFRYLSLADVVADNSSSSYFVLAKDARVPRGLDFTHLKMRLLVDGALKTEAESSAISGNPVE